MGASSADSTSGLCPLGTFGATPGMSSVQSCDGLCPAGTYGAVEGASSADTCAKSTRLGVYSTFVGASVDGLVSGRCSPGTFGAASGLSSSASCAQCPAGTFEVGDGASACSGRLSSGMYSSAIGLSAAASATPCPAGRFSPAVGLSSQEACTPCPTGYYSATPGLTSSASCVTCPSGTYASATGLSSDSCSGVCGANQGSLAGVCRPNAGYFGPSIGGVISVEPCPAGTYSEVIGASASMVCLQCGPDRQSGPGSGTPILCKANAGFVGPDGTTPVTPCPVGTEKTTIGDDMCVEIRNQTRLAAVSEATAVTTTAAVAVVGVATIASTAMGGVSSVGAASGMRQQAQFMAMTSELGADDNSTDSDAGLGWMNFHLAPPHRKLKPLGNPRRKLLSVAKEVEPKAKKADCSTESPIALFTLGTLFFCFIAMLAVIVVRTIVAHFHRKKHMKNHPNEPYDTPDILRFPRWEISLYNMQFMGIVEVSGYAFVSECDTWVMSGILLAVAVPLFSVICMVIYVFTNFKTVAAWKTAAELDAEKLKRGEQIGQGLGARFLRWNRLGEWVCSSQEHSRAFMTKIQPMFAGMCLRPGHHMYFIIPWMKIMLTASLIASGEK